MAAAAKVTAALLFVGGATALVAVGTGTRGAPSHASPSQTVVTATPVQAAKQPRTPSTTAADPIQADPQTAEPARLGSREAPNEASRTGTPVTTVANAASRAPTTTGVSVDAPEPPISSLREEALLIREANASLESGDAARSLVLAEEHARRFPNGALLPEGAVVHILALCQTGRLEQARAETGAFLLAHPEGPLSMRVRSSCGGVNP
jgi:hypothetical protein